MKLFFIVSALLINFNVYASRGWYISFSGLSAKQDHTISDYASTKIVNDIPQSYSTLTASITDTTYNFTTDSDSSQPGYTPFSTLTSATSGAYINSSETFQLATNDPTGTVAPIVNGNATNTTTSQTVTHLDSTIATVSYTGDNGIYDVTLTPKNWSASINTIQNDIQAELDSSLLTTTEQLQSFLDTIQEGNTGVELSIGYKFRPFQSSWFFAPQLDFSYFASDKIQTAYANTNKDSFSSTADSTHTDLTERYTLDSRIAFGMVGKFGYENSILVGLTKIPFNIYGILGGTSGMRTYRDIRTNNLGAKYGIGAEIFISRKFAFFAEFYQISFFEQNVDYSETKDYTNSADVQSLIDEGTGTTVTITNGNDKTFTANYSSLNESMGNVSYQVDEVFKIQSKTSALKLGISYYFN